jgi:hypothetical protein
MQKKILDSVVQSIKKEEDEEDEGIKNTMALHEGWKGVKGEINWGNLKEKDGVCHRCGRSGHVAHCCVADMPDDVKAKYLMSKDAAATCEDPVILANSDNEYNVTVPATFQSDGLCILSDGSDTDTQAVSHPNSFSAHCPSVLSLRGCTKRKLEVDIEVVGENSRF